jgi:hypothetical protein
VLERDLPVAEEQRKGTRELGPFPRDGLD